MVGWLDGIPGVVYASMDDGRRLERYRTHGAVCPIMDDGGRLGGIHGMVHTSMDGSRSLVSIHGVIYTSMDDGTRLGDIHVEVAMHKYG